MKILYLVLGCFLSFSVLLFLAVFVSALITLFVAFESYFYGLGSTVTHKKFFLFDAQKLPKNREFLAWDLYCNIDMVTRTGIELIRTPDMVFSKTRKNPILRHFRALQVR